MIGFLGDPRDFDVLAAGLADPQLRYTALEGLAYQPDAGRIDAVARSLLDDADPIVRSKVARIVSFLARPRALEVLLPLAGDPVPHVRMILGWELGGMRDRAAEPTLRALLADPDEQATEHVGQDGSLEVGQRIHEYRDIHPALPADLTNFACLTGTQKSAPGERVDHVGRTTVRNTSPLNVPAHHTPTKGLHRPGELIELRAERSVLAGEHADDRDISSGQPGGARPASVPSHADIVADGKRPHIGGCGSRIRCG